MNMPKDWKENQLTKELMIWKPTVTRDWPLIKRFLPDKSSMISWCSLSIWNLNNDLFERETGLKPTNRNSTLKERVFIMAGRRIEMKIPRIEMKIPRKKFAGEPLEEEKERCSWSNLAQRLTSCLVNQVSENPRIQNKNGKLSLVILWGLFRHTSHWIRNCYENMSLDFQLPGILYLFKLQQEAIHQRKEIKFLISGLLKVKKS